MKFYEVIAQFAKADAPSFYTEGYESYLVEAKDYFNIRSRVATNPKEITELHIIDDETIRIIFRSQDELNVAQVSRSLRVFSMYLIDKGHPLNFSSLVSGKRLFRMQASEFAVDNKVRKDNEQISDEELLIQMSKLIFQERESPKKRTKLDKIKTILKEEKNV